jgi:hypothetical protein
VGTFFYYGRRSVAIALGLALTGYSAWASWTLTHMMSSGPLQRSPQPCCSLCVSTHGTDRQWVRFGMLGMLGAAAAVFSGSMVLERVASTSEARNHQARSANLPRAEARKALDEARDLKTAEAAVRDETKKGGCKAVCEGLKKEADAARQRVDRARAELVALGATSAENPAATLLGPYAEMFQTATLLGLPIWIELAAPVVLAAGFAPGRRKAPAPQPKPKQRKEKRAPRRPAAQDGVTDCVEAYRQRHGRAPKVADVRQAFGVSKTTAWRRIRNAG